MGNLGSDFMLDVRLFLPGVVFRRVEITEVKFGRRLETDHHLVEHDIVQVSVD